MEIHLAGKNNSIKEETLKNVSYALDDCSGADLENLVNLAALQAVRQAQVHKSTPVLKDAEFNQAVQKFIAERNNSLISPRTGVVRNNRNH